MIVSAFACLWACKLAQDLVHFEPTDISMSHAILHFFLRRRHKSSNGEEKTPTHVGPNHQDRNVVRAGVEASSATEYDGEAGTHTGQDKTEMSPSIAHHLGEEIGKQRTLLQREFDMQRYQGFCE